MTEANHGTRRAWPLWTAVMAVATLVGCAPMDDKAPDGDVEVDAEVESEGEGVGVVQQSLSTRLYARQELKIRGAFTEYASYEIVPTWSASDEHPNPITVAGVSHDGRCSHGYERSSISVVKTSGNGNCSFEGWLSPGDPTDCRAEVKLDHSAGGDNIWNGACLVKIYEKPSLVRANSCLNRCDQYNTNAVCQCDRSCDYHGDCCPDFGDVCF